MGFQAIQLIADGPSDFACAIRDNNTHSKKKKVMELSLERKAEQR